MRNLHNRPVKVQRTEAPAQLSEQIEAKDAGKLQEAIETVKEKVAELFDFENVYETTAGSTVTSHCGKNTIGVLFILN